MHKKFHRYNAIARTVMLFSFASAAIIFTRSCDREAPNNAMQNKKTIEYNEALANTLDDMTLEDMLQGIGYLQATVDDLVDEDTKIESIDDNLRAFFEKYGTNEAFVPKLAFTKIIPNLPNYSDEARQQSGKTLTEALAALFTVSFEKCKEQFIQEKATKLT